MEKLDLSKENWHAFKDANAFICFNTTGGDDLQVNFKPPNLGAATMNADSKVGMHKFKKNREKEILGLLEKNVFEPVQKSEADGHRVFGSRFVGHIKTKERAMHTQNQDWWYKASMTNLLAC